MKKFLYLSVLLTVATMGSMAQDKVSERIIQIGKNDGRVMQHLDVLSNIIGGRPIGSDANLNATEWARRTLESWGFDVEVEKVGELPVGFNRGPWFGKMLSEDGKILHFATPSYTRGTRGRERGHVLREPMTRAELERMKGSLNGAWVLVNGTSKGWPIDWSPKGDSLRAAVMVKNDSIAAAFRKEHPGMGRTASAERPKFIETPALFYREMVEAGVRGFIQAAKVPITALYDRNIMTGVLTEGNLPPGTKYPS